MKPENFEMDAPEPDDLGVEIEYDLYYNGHNIKGGVLCRSPYRLFIVDADTPEYFRENGFLYQTFHYNQMDPDNSII